MSNLDQVWGSVSADSDNEENVTPPPGTYVVRIAGTRAGTSKKGEQYFAVDLKDDQAGHKWMIYKQFTKNGQPHEGSIKSAKITLRQLGLDVQAPAQLEGALGSIEGRYYAVEVKASDKVNQTTGQFYLNTDVTGAASPPTMAAANTGALQQAAAQVGQAPAQPAPQVQAPPAYQAPPAMVAAAQAPQGQTLDQAMMAAEHRHGIVPGTVQPAQAPGARFGDTPPWQ